MTASVSVARLTTGPHCVVPPAMVEGERIALGADDSHHLAAVLRAGPGDPVSVGDGVGTLYQARIADIGRGVVLSIGERFEVPAPPVALRVVVGMPKGKKLDDVVRQLTELGVERIAPVVAERSESRPKGEGAERALDRWRGVAHAAVKQSRRAYLPTIEPVVPWTDAFAGPGVVCWEEANTPLRDVIAELADAPLVTLAIGPEGGLTRDEVAASGLKPAVLGSTVLRAETATVAASAAALAFLGRFG